MSGSSRRHFTPPAWSPTIAFRVGLVTLLVGVAVQYPALYLGSSNQFFLWLWTTLPFNMIFHISATFGCCMIAVSIAMRWCTERAEQPS